MVGLKLCPNSTLVYTLLLCLDRQPAPVTHQKYNLEQTSSPSASEKMEKCIEPRDVLVKEDQPDKLQSSLDRYNEYDNHLQYCVDHSHGSQLTYQDEGCVAKEGSDSHDHNGCHVVKDMVDQCDDCYELWDEFFGKQIPDLCSGNGKGMCREEVWPEGCLEACRASTNTDAISWNDCMNIDADLDNFVLSQPGDHDCVDLLQQATPCTDDCSLPWQLPDSSTCATTAVPELDPGNLPDQWLDLQPCRHGLAPELMCDLAVPLQEPLASWQEQQEQESLHQQWTHEQPPPPQQQWQENKADEDIKKLEEGQPAQTPMQPNMAVTFEAPKESDPNSDSAIPNFAEIYPSEAATITTARHRSSGKNQTASHFSSSVTTASICDHSRKRACQWVNPDGIICGMQTDDLKKHVKTHYHGKNRSSVPTNASDTLLYTTTTGGGGRSGSSIVSNTLTCRWNDCLANFGSEAALTCHLSLKHLRTCQNSENNISNNNNDRDTNTNSASSSSSNSAPWKCPVPDCGKSFTYKQVRDEHVSSCHRGDRIHCPICHQWLNAGCSNFRRHMAKHSHMHQRIKCRHAHLGCPRSFPRSDNLRRHEACCKYGKKAAAAAAAAAATTPRPADASVTDASIWTPTSRDATATTIATTNNVGINADGDVGAGFYLPHHHHHQHNLHYHHHGHLLHQHHHHHHHHHVLHNHHSALP